MSIYDADDCLSTNLLNLSMLFNGYLSIENTYRGIDIYDYKYDGEEEDILHPIKKGDIKDIEVKEIKIHPNIDDWIFDDYEVISINAVRADFSEHLSGELINYESESSRNRSDTIDSVSVYDTESVNSSIKYISNHRKSTPLVVNEHEDNKKRINSERIIPIKEVKEDNISSINDVNMIRQDTVIISKGRSRTLSETGINRSLNSNSENSLNSLRIRKTNSDFSTNYDKIIESLNISGSESNKEKEYIDKEKKQDEKEKLIEKLKEKKENKEMRKEDKREEEKVMDKSKENEEKDEKDSKKSSTVNSRKSSIHIIIEDKKEPENSNIKPETITEESITPSSTIDKYDQKNDSDSDTPFSYEKKFFHINRSSSDFTDSDIIRDNTEPPLPNRVLEIRKSSLTYNSQSRPASPSTFIRNNRVLDTNDLVYSPKLGSMSSYVDSPVNRRFSSMTDLSLTDESDLDDSNMSLNNEKKVEIKENEKVENKEDEKVEIKEDEKVENKENKKVEIKEDEKDEKESKNKEIIDNK